MGGRAYWFESITISSPSVPNGTIGTADFTLFFEGGMSTGPSISGTNTYFAELEYRWSGGGDSSDGKPDINSGELTSRRSEVFSTHTTTTGPEFYLNQPRNHRMTFRFGVPFDFTIWISARGSAWDNAPSNSKVSLRMTGWNGFNNIRIRDGAAVVDAVIGSQTGFNYGGPGTISFEQWASQFQLAADAMSGDANQNGVSNLLEYALGRDPMAPGGGEPIILGKAMEEGGEKGVGFRLRQGTASSFTT